MRAHLGGGGQPTDVLLLSPEELAAGIRLLARHASSLLQLAAFTVAARGALYLGGSRDESTLHRASGHSGAAPASAPARFRFEHVFFECGSVRVAHALME